MEQQEAIDQIQLIRDMMHKASQKFFFSPWQWVEWGVVVIIGGALTHWRLAIGDTVHISTVWIGVLIVGGTLEGVAWILDGQRRGLDPFSPFMLQIWGVLSCLLIPSTIFTVVLAQLGLPLYIVGTWLTTIGAAMFMLVLLGERKELVLFGLLMLVCGILSVSIFIKEALHIGVLSFGVGGLFMGIYMLMKEKRHEKNEA